jgi:hypothetical protein
MSAIVPGRSAAALAAVLAATAGCASPGLAPLPLRPEPIAYADTLPIPEPGVQDERRELRSMLIHGPLQLAEPFDPGLGEALNLTHHDDVVSSSWWERRMGYRPISPAELARGPAAPQDAPATTGPLVIKSVKTDGVTPGFTMEDQNDNTYIVKFDPPGMQHLQSAPGVIGNRLMWGAGYHVPEDYVTVFDRDRLVVDEDATIEEDGVERPLRIEDVRRVLDRAEAIDGGDRYLALASKYVPGTPKGPFLFQGTRDDDPNDHFAHEHRRELRGLQVISSWMNNTDLREGNTLDVYVAPGYLRHYLIDFGATLGSASTRPKHPKDEDERPADVYRTVARIATLGLFDEEWETESAELLDPSLGFLRGEDFDPKKWDSSWTNPAFAAMTDADAYWAAKIVAAFTEEHLRAAVQTGALPRAELEETLVERLTARRHRLIEFWFGQVSTVEEPVVAQQGSGLLRLSFRDLGIEQGLWDAGSTVYDWVFEHDALDGSGSAQPRAGADQLLDVTWAGGSAGTAPSSELAVLEIVTRRPGLAPEPARVFLRWDGRGYQVVGLTHGDPEK